MAEIANDYSGYSMSTAGDINGDGVEGFTSLALKATIIEQDVPMWYLAIFPLFW